MPLREDGRYMSDESGEFFGVPTQSPFRVRLGSPHKALETGGQPLLIKGFTGGLGKTTANPTASDVVELAANVNAHVSTAVYNQIPWREARTYNYYSSTQQWKVSSIGYTIQGSWYIASSCNISLPNYNGISIAYQGVCVQYTGPYIIVSGIINADNSTSSRTLFDSGVATGELIIPIPIKAIQPDDGLTRWWNFFIPNMTWAEYQAAYMPLTP